MPRETHLTMQKYRLSEQLSMVCDGKTAMTRADVTKSVWKYIKERHLQRQDDRRVVQCDLLLKNVFGKDEISMLDIGKGLQQHIFERVGKPRRP
ncbi:hypothetical protein PBRA_001710 [Plasmodiophora brassicae]|nr:hypothetical protein PBRA_001710 [Plasmodiophora brassicae]